MDLFDVVRACFRRWYVLLPLLVIAAWITHNMYASVKPVYYSNAVIGFSPPSTRMDQTAAGTPAPRNGLLDMGGASLIANMTAIALHETSTSMQVAAGGGQLNYVAKMFPVPGSSPELPMIMIEATEPDPTSSLKTVQLVVAQADPAVVGLQQQANVADDQLVRTFVVSPPTGPVTAMPSRTRSTVAIGVAGFGIAAVVTVVVDVLLLRWKARRQKGKKARVHIPDVRTPETLPAQAAAPAHDVTPTHDVAAAALAPLTPRAAPGQVADPAYTTAPVGVDPAEAYSHSKHAADHVRTDGQ